MGLHEKQPLNDDMKRLKIFLNIEPGEEAPVFPVKDRTPKILDRFIKGKDGILRECTLDAASKNRWPEFLPASEVQI